MRVRRLIATPKLQTSDTGWSANDMPPRHCPIYTEPSADLRFMEMRSTVACEVGGTRHFLVALCNTRRDNWQAFLIVDTTIGVSVVARFEHHGSHPGLHGHAHCDRGEPLETGRIWP